MKNPLDLTNWRGDLAGGMTAGIVALPLALAFGVQSGLGAVAGIYSAIALGIFASVFGGTRTQISGPTGPMTVVSTMIVVHAIERAGSLDKAMGIILATFFLAGLLQVVFGWARLGNTVKFIPFPVVSGFMTGIAIITILIQVFPAMGLEGPKRFLDIVLQFPEATSHANFSAVLITAGTVALVYMIPRFTRKVPSSLFALIFISLLVYMTGIQVPVIGDIPHGLPHFQLDTIFGISAEDLPFIMVPGITLALLGCVDSLLTSVIVDNISKTRHNSNQELVGQGIGNMMSSLIGGLPGAGTTMTSVINTTTGSRTKLGGVVHGSLLLSVLLGASQYAEHIPQAVLAGILITIGFDIVDYKGLRHLRSIPKSEAGVLVTVMLMTVFVDLIKAVAVGMILATFLFMKKMADLGEKESDVSPLADFALGQGEKPFGVSFHSPESLLRQVYVKKVQGPLFFGFANKIQDRVNALYDARVIIFDLDRVPYIDQTGVYAMEEVVKGLREKGVQVMFANVHGEPMRMFKKLKLIPDLIPENMLFPNMTQCAKKLDEVLIPESVALG